MNKKAKAAIMGHISSAIELLQQERAALCDLYPGDIVTSPVREVLNVYDESIDTLKRARQSTFRIGAPT